MATLTESQIEYVRDMSGDDKTDDAGNYEVSDVTLQAIYDDTAQGGNDLDKTVFYVIKRRLGKAARLTPKSGEFGTDGHNVKFENLRKLLALWSGITGISIAPAGATATTGTLGLGIDAQPDSEWT